MDSELPLFAEGAVLMFHSRSRDATPGRGAGEALGDPPPSFVRLASYKDWRRTLSNFALTPFVLDGLRWGSVEHCFQGTKFARVAPEYYRQFSLDSGSALGLAQGADVKRAGGRRAHPLPVAELERWDREKRDVMRRALYAKFSQNQEPREILLATGLAKLTHQPLRARHAHVEIELMEVRRQLRQSLVPRDPAPGDVTFLFDGQVVATLVLDPVQDSFPWCAGALREGPHLDEVRSSLALHVAADLEHDFAPEHPSEGPYRDSDLAKLVEALVAFRAGALTPREVADSPLARLRERSGDELDAYLRFLDWRRWRAVTPSGDDVVSIGLPPALDFVSRRFSFRA